MSLETITTDTKLYRARVNEFGNSEPYEITEMGPPPRKKIIRHGRVTPPGIRYFYLSSDIDTCIAEVRPYLQSYVTVGEFRLKERLHFVALYDYAVGDSEYYIGLKFLLSSGFSRPIDFNKESIDYLPTQFFAELVKRRGLAGIKFLSSVSSSRGENVTIFNPKLVECVSTTSYKITGLNFEKVT